MAEYRVAIKESVFRETPFDEDEFDDEPELVFDSKDDAQEWIATQNDPGFQSGKLNLHKAHPDDTSGVDGYLVFRNRPVWTLDS